MNEFKVEAAKAVELCCTDLDIAGRGVAKANGAVYFVEGLMVDEVARVLPLSGKDKGLIERTGSLGKDKVIHAKITKIIKPSPLRREMQCELHDKCGGCPLEHLPNDMAMDAKVRGVAKILSKTVMQGTREANMSKVSKNHGSSKLGRNSTIKQALAKKQAERKNAAREAELLKLCQAAAATVAEPDFVLSANELAYRRTCRLAIRADHGKMHLGFRESMSQNLVPISKCLVLTERLNTILPEVRNLVNRLSCKKSIGHVELLDSDGKVGVLLRLTSDLNSGDASVMERFAQDNDCVVSVLEPFSQLDNTVVVREKIVAGSASDLFIQCLDCKLSCSPSSFVQVNAHMNQQLLTKVMEQVQPYEGQKVLDLFSGLGNFALPIAKAGASVVGIDIVSDMVARANENAVLNGLDSSRARFYVADLEEPFEAQLWAKEQYDVVVLDPGRLGAKRAVSYLAKMKPKKIVMISCNPLAAARDSSQLLAANYTIESWGAFDMFPRTTHLEIMLTFVKV